MEDGLAGTLSGAEQAELRRLAADLLERLTRTLVRHPGLTLPEPVRRPGDADDEYRTRRDRLRRVRAAMLASVLVEDVAAEFTAAEAADAVWVGASLADLGATSDTTRQAARKRWPDLGLIYRTRRWLGAQHDVVVAVVGALLEHAGELRGVGMDRIQALRATVDAVQPQPDHWRALSDAVDRHLRAVAQQAVPTTSEAVAAVDGAQELVVDFDAARARPSDGG
jgi:hypothetical protein